GASLPPGGRPAARHPPERPGARGEADLPGAGAAFPPGLGRCTVCAGTAERRCGPRRPEPDEPDRRGFQGLRDHGRDVRGVARGLGSLARNAGLLGVIGSACFAASGAGAVRAPDLFELTIRGTAVADFDHTTAPVERLECETSSRAQGHRTVVFRSSRPTLVRFVSGRIRPVAVRGLEGTVKLGGTNTETSVCAG